MDSERGSSHALVVITLGIHWSEPGGANKLGLGGFHNTHMPGKARSLPGTLPDNTLPNDQHNTTLHTPAERNEAMLEKV